MPHALLFILPQRQSWGNVEPVSRELCIAMSSKPLDVTFLLWSYFVFVVVHFCKADATLKHLTKLFIFAIKIIVLKAY